MAGIDRPWRRCWATLVALVMLGGWLTAGVAEAASAPACIAVTYQARSYCAASITDVKATAYGVDKRVVLRSVTVERTTSTTVTVAAWTVPPCPPDKWCGQLLTLVELPVAWSGTPRPAYGDVIDLYGVTIRGSIRPVGYVWLDNCPIEWC